MFMEHAYPRNKISLITQLPFEGMREKNSLLFYGSQREKDDKWQQDLSC